jgi:hypothetical protein
MTEIIVPGIDTDNLNALLEAAQSSNMLDEMDPAGALRKMAGALECEHPWFDTIEDQDCTTRWYRCELCGATPAFIQAADQEARLEHCGHTLSGNLLDELEEHVNFDWICEESFRSCDMLMPSWRCVGEGQPHDDGELACGACEGISGNPRCTQAGMTMWPGR